MSNTKIDIGEKYKHYKTKDTYEVMNLATMQLPDDTGLDMCECVIYKKEEDVRLWVRPAEMFLEKVNDQDGIEVSRFERV